MAVGLQEARLCWEQDHSAAACPSGQAETSPGSETGKKKKTTKTPLLSTEKQCSLGVLCSVVVGLWMTQETVVGSV